MAFIEGPFRKRRDYVFTYETNQRIDIGIFPDILGKAVQPVDPAFKYVGTYRPVTCPLRTALGEPGLLPLQERNEFVPQGLGQVAGGNPVLGRVGATIEVGQQAFQSSLQDRAPK